MFQWFVFQFLLIFMVLRTNCKSVSHYNYITSTYEFLVLTHVTSPHLRFRTSSQHFGTKTVRKSLRWRGFQETIGHRRSEEITSLPFGNRQTLLIVLNYVYKLNTCFFRLPLRRNYCASFFGLLIDKGDLGTLIYIYITQFTVNATSFMNLWTEGKLWSWCLQITLFL